MCRLAGFLALFCVFCGAGFAEVLVRGQVVSENNEPIAGARLVFESRTNGEIPSGQPDIFRTLTGPTGEWIVRLPEPGEYRVLVEKDGYFALRDNAVNVGEIDDPELTFALNPVREVAESIEVSAVAETLDSGTTSNEQRLSITQILSIPYPASNNLKNSLRIMPGVTQDSRGGLHINGGAEEQVLYTLDGFNVGDPLTGRLETRVSVEAVQAVQIESGRYSSEFGKGSAGVLAIQTSSGDDKLRYAATNFVPAIENHKGLTIAGWTPRLSLSGPLRRGRAWFSNSLFTHYDKRIVRDLPKGQDRTSAIQLSNMLRGQVNLTPSNILYTGLLTNIRTAPRDGLSALDAREATVDRRARQWFFHIKDQIYFGGGALLEYGYAANRSYGREIPQGHEYYRLTPEGRRGNYFLDARRESNRDQWLTNVFLPSFHLLGSHHLKTGIDLNRVSFRQDARRSGLVYYRANNMPLRQVFFGGDGHLEHANYETGWYVQDSWKVRPNVLVETGARVDWDQLLRNWNVSPRLGISWSPASMESMKISGGYAVVHDAARLQTFTRPLDQYSITTHYAPDGSISRASAISMFLIDNPSLKTPRYVNWSASLEQRWPGSVFTRMGFLHKRGNNGLTYLDVLGSRGPAPEDIARFGTSNFDGIFDLTNLRFDEYESFEVAVRQPLRQQYEWMISYMRSRSLSNAVLDINIDNPTIVSSNAGRMPWDSPNRLLSWGYLPTLWPNWAVAYLLEYRTGFPFSVEDESGSIQGVLNQLRFPPFFELNLHLERRFSFKGNRWAFRFGFNNITNHLNYNVVNNNTASPNFMQFYGGQARSLNLRLRWLGKL